MKPIDANELLRQLGKWDISKLYLVEEFKKLVKEQEEVSADDIVKEHFADADKMSEMQDAMEGEAE